MKLFTTLFICFTLFTSCDGAELFLLLGSSDSPESNEQGGGSSNNPPDNDDSAEAPDACPVNFIGIPALAGYTTNGFCVAKYEMKDDGAGGVISQAASQPLGNQQRPNAIAFCQALGPNYDLITNDEWQTIARNIESIAVNWDTGVIGSVGGLNQGHSDNGPSITLSAGADDAFPCIFTGQACTDISWNSQRRTHVLSTNEVIWDFAGNAEEWVKDDNSNNYGANEYVSQITAITHPSAFSLSGGTTTVARNAKDQFGPVGDFSALNAGARGGLGFSILNSAAGAVRRGGSFSALSAGVFFASLTNSPNSSAPSVGFRCVYRP